MVVPKFRAWRKTAQKMVNVSSLDWKNDENEEESLSAIWWYSTKNALVSSADYVSDEFIIMQFTGSLDKDGKDIFDRDIVETTRFCGGSYEDYRGVVKFLEGAWMIDTGEELIPLWSEIEETIVIGNIYEHPELMEK
ncbi:MULTISPECIES: YopX family protein [Streptococcus]|uniref:YopX family protein n=1 Tax=Streptococcus TaxID=1301 RepID=UPI0012DDA9BB|nr:MULTISPECIES: YopX family protein [Streptococcus]QHF55438.1 hypothetical protein BZG42_08835 [Streptococcus sp. DAT741]